LELVASAVPVVCRKSETHAIGSDQMFTQLANHLYTGRLNQDNATLTRLHSTLSHAHSVNDSIKYKRARPRARTRAHTHTYTHTHTHTHTHTQATLSRRGNHGSCRGSPCVVVGLCGVPTGCRIAVIGDRPTVADLGWYSRRVNHAQLTSHNLAFEHCRRSSCKQICADARGQARR
jgi:hypothetical protein